MTTQPSTTAKIDPGILSERHLGRYFSLLTPEGGIRWRHVLLTYAISHGFILACWNALFWDDWLVYSGGPDGVREFFDNCQRCIFPYRSAIESFLIVPGPWLMRLITFIIYPTIAILLHDLIKRTKWLTSEETSTFVLLVILLPMNAARVSLINFQYSFSLLLFVIGARMTLCNNRLVRMAAFGPIFLSMFTASFQLFVFAWIAALFVLMCTQPKQRTIETALLLVLLAISPLAIRYLSPRLFPQTGVRDGYNRIMSANILRTAIYCGALVVPLISLLFKRWRGHSANRESTQLSIGLGILALGTAPYQLVGHFRDFSDFVVPFFPDLSDWDSRHQLLQPFGLALVILALANMIGPRKATFLSLVFASSIALSVLTYSSYYLDSLKQREVISAISSNQRLLSGVTSAIVVDMAPDFNARNRTIRPYEWAELFKAALDRPIIAVSPYEAPCEEHNPTRRITVVTKNGRLKSILTNSAGISIQVTNIDWC